MTITTKICFLIVIFCCFYFLQWIYLGDKNKLSGLNFWQRQQKIALRSLAFVAAAILATLIALSVIYPTIIWLADFVNKII